MVKLDEILAIRKTLVMSFLPKFRILEKNSPSSDILPVKETLNPTIPDDWCQSMQRIWYGS
jgi:hypothetical protein